MMKVLLLGANGWLAQFLHHDFIEWQKGSQSFELICTYHNTDPSWIAGESKFHLSLDSPTAVQEILSKVKPDIILHFAAVSSPAKCHQDEALAFSVNAPMHIIDAVKLICPSCLYIFTSTDMVYDGEHAPYLPENITHPVNIYGKTKLSFERALLDNLPNSIILRLSNMLGPNYQYQPCGEKFLEFLKKAHAKNQFIGLKADEIRSFVDVRDVTTLILRIIEKYSASSREDLSWIPTGTNSNSTSSRIYNVGGPVGLSRFDLARLYCAAVDSELVIQSQDFSQKESDTKERKEWDIFIMLPAPRTDVVISQLVNPRDITMDITLTEDVWNMKFRHVSEYIHLY